MTTVVTDPARPDGRAGWFATAPTVTLTATDSGLGVARTEHRIGSGAWTTYAAPFAVTAQGLQVLEVRSIDRAGNVETALKKVVTALAADGELGPKFANKVLQLDKDATRAERRGERREARAALKAIRKLVRAKVDGELRQALIAQVRDMP